MLSNFLVNSTADGGDINPGDGICDDGTGNCTLRAAIAEGNSLAGSDSISFNIPGAGPHTIRPLSELPPIIDPVVIDGYTQPGSSPNTNPVGIGLNTVLTVELDGSLAGASANGLAIWTTGTTVRGLAMNRFAHGIFVGAGNSVIEGNFIGSDVTGTVGAGNAFDGVHVYYSSQNVIGGSVPSARNLISGNRSSGIEIGGGVAFDTASRAI